MPMLSCESMRMVDVRSEGYCLPVMSYDAHSIIEDSSEIWGVVDVNRHLYRPVVFSYTCVAAAAFQRASLNYFAISG